MASTVRFVTRVFLPIGAALLGACTTSPYHNQRIASTSSAVTVSGWTLWTGREIEVQCRQYLYGTTWHTAETITSTTTPEQFLHTITQGGETWYRFSASVVIPEYCWFDWHGGPTTELRFVDEGNYHYETFTEDGLDCVYEAFFDGDAPSVAGTSCGMDTHRIYLNAES